MYHFEKKNSNIFFLEGTRKNVWGPSENVSPGHTVALDRPGEVQKTVETDSQGKLDEHHQMRSEGHGHYLTLLTYLFSYSKKPKN